MSTKYLVLLSFLFVSLAACNDTDNKIKEKGNLSVSVNNDIKVFNKETGEIVLSTLSVEDINGLSGAYLTFYLDDFPIFESIPVIPKSSSIIHNDLVLAIDGAKLYLLDGYPSLDVLGSNKSEAERLRNENFNKRNTSWNKFIDYLQEVGKIME